MSFSIAIAPTPGQSGAENAEELRIVDAAPLRIPVRRVFSKCRASRP
jgi:hypothetical protein